jgi:hypothetical protein
MRPLIPIQSSAHRRASECAEHDGSDIRSEMVDALPYSSTQT